MKNILAIYTSVAGEHSTSTSLAKEWICSQKGRLVERDLATASIGHYNGMTLHSFFNSDSSLLSSEQQLVLKASDMLIAEVQSADCIVLAVPMYNFGIPSTLKAWFDQIARPGKTFTFTESGSQGLLKGKKAVIILSRGGLHKDSNHDFMAPYLKQFLGFIGITDIEFIFVEGTAMGSDFKALSVTKAVHELAKVEI